MYVVLPNYHLYFCDLDVYRGRFGHLACFSPEYWSYFALKNLEITEGRE